MTANHEHTPSTEEVRDGYSRKPPGHLGPETIRALRDYLAEDAAHKIITAVLASGQYTRTETITLLRSITANPDVLDRIEATI